MVVIDATILMLLFRPNVPARLTDSKGKPIDHVPERIAYLVKTLEGIKSKIVIPTPVLSEILVRATAEETQKILEEIEYSWVPLHNWMGPFCYMNQWVTWAGI